MTAGEERTTPPTSGSAIAALVLTLLGLLQVLPFLGTVAGLVMGYSARNDIRNSGGRLGGEGVAQAAIILGWIGVALYIVGICLFILTMLGLISLPVGMGICAQLGNMQ
jgi:hypothetical protein